MFSKCGTISSIRIVRDPITAVSKGIAFVNFEVSGHSHQKREAGHFQYSLLTKDIK